MHAVQWSWLHFRDLSAPLLYRMLALRSAVFVLEQRSIYQDPDGLDMDAHFLIATDRAGEVEAAVRVLGPGGRYAEPSLGRVCVSDRHRGTGLGRAMVTQALGNCRSLYPGLPIRISAQAYLRSFYTSLGFEAVSDEYDEDGIVHVEMLAPAIN